MQRRFSCALFKPIVTILSISANLIASVLIFINTFVSNTNIENKSEMLKRRYFMEH